MPRITVKLYTAMNGKLVRNKTDIYASTAAEAVENLEKHYGDELIKEIREVDGNIRNHYVISLNGYTLSREKLEKVKLSENDILYIFPAVSGG